MLKNLSKLLISFCLVSVIGCGFHLRGNANIPEAIKNIYLQFETKDDIIIGHENIMR